MADKIQTETLGEGTAAVKSKSGRVIPDTPALKQSAPQPADDKIGVVAKLGAGLTFEAVTERVKEYAVSLRRSAAAHAKTTGDIVDYIAYGRRMALSKVTEFMGFADRKYLGDWLIQTGVIETLRADREADKGTASRYQQLSTWSDPILMGEKTQAALANGVKIGDKVYTAASDALRESGLSVRAVYVAFNQTIQEARAQGPGGRRSNAPVDADDAVDKAVADGKFKVAVKDPETGETSNVTVTDSKALTLKAILSLIGKFAGQWDDDDVNVVMEAMQAPAQAEPAPAQEQKVA